MVGELIRKVGFWQLDRLKGGKIKKYYRQVCREMNGDELGEQRVNGILEYAKNKVPYYSKRSFDRFEDYPILTKKDYMKELDAFRSIDFFGEKLYRASTSGSTGVPFTALQDENKRNKHTADLVFFHQKCGWNIGERYIFLRAWTSLYNNSKWYKLKNNIIPYDVLRFGKTEIEQLIKQVQCDKSIRLIVGYGSALGLIADYLSDNDVCINSGIRVIISDSDKLAVHHRKELEKRFSCNVVDRYSNEEQGLIAFSYFSGCEYEVNRSSYRVEILKLNSNEYAEPGEIGRVIITDLYNKAMPFIRYELGDLAVCNDDTSDARYISDLQGRMSDLIRICNGTLISSATVNNYFESKKGIEQYQFEQINDGSFILRVVEKQPHFYSDSEYKNLIRKIYLGEPRLSIERLPSIPIGENGKFRTVIGIK